MQLEGRTALVTGASSGLGRALAIRLGQAGAKLVLTGRRHARLLEVAAACPKAVVITANLGEVAERVRLAERAAQAFGGIGLLVNCAGYPAVGESESLSWREIEYGTTINLLAPMHLTALLLPRLLAQPPAMIVNVSSLSAKVPLPTQNIYTASKYGLAGFGKAVRRDVEDRGVSVMNVYPGAFDTEMNPAAVREVVADMHGRRLEAQPPEHAANAIVRAIERDQRELTVASFKEHMLATTEACAPRSLDRAIASLRPVIQTFSKLVRERFPVPADPSEERLAGSGNFPDDDL